MKILLAIHQFDDPSAGGTEVYTAALAKALSRRHEVAVLYPSKNPEGGRRVSRDGVRHFALGAEAGGEDPFLDNYTGRSHRAAVERAILEFRPDVLHVQHLSGLGLSLLEAAHDVPRCVMTLADYWPFCPRGQMIRDDLDICSAPDLARCAACVFVGPAIRNLENRARTLSPISFLRAPKGRDLREKGVRLALAGLAARAGVFLPAVARAREEIDTRLSRIRNALSRVDLFLAPSQFIGGRYAALGVPYHKIRHFDYGFEELAPSPATSPGGRGGKPLRLGFIGTLIPSKGPHVLAGAIRLLPKGSAEAHFWGQFVSYHGDGSYKDLLAGKLAGLPHRFHGPLAHGRVAEALGEMDVLVVPSVWLENSPLVIHEALQAGVPVIASRIGGIPELVREGETGLLFGVGDEKDLARCIEDVLSGRVRFARRETWKAIVEPIEEHTRRLEAIYLEGAVLP